MTTPKAKFAGLALIAALCAGVVLGLTACADERARTGAETPQTEAAFNAGAAAYKRGDYATALREWRPLAEQGHAKAQYSLGNMYRDGVGVPQDYAEAVKWYGEAAVQGQAEAQYHLGVMAQQGDADAQYNLGFIYDVGLGVPRDAAEAVKWYRKAAEQGNVIAQNSLGAMYFDRYGDRLDYVRAHTWYNLAASGFPPGKDRDKAARNRDSVAKRMTPAQIADAQKLAREWGPKK